MFKTNIVFHQTLEIKGISLFVLYEGQINRCPSRYFCPKLYMHVLTMAAFQVILEADEDDNRPSLKQPRVYRYRYMFCFTILLFTDLHLYCLLVSELEAYLTHPPPNIWLYLSPHNRVRKLFLLISLTIIWHCRRYCRDNFSVSLCTYRCGAHNFRHTNSYCHTKTKRRFQVTSERMKKAVSWPMIPKRIRRRRFLLTS